MLLEICLWYEEGKVWELEEAVEFIGSRSFPGKLPYDDEIATSWLSCKLGLSRTKAQWGLGCYQVYRARHTPKSHDQRAECPEGPTDRAWNLWAAYDTLWHTRHR